MWQFKAAYYCPFFVSLWLILVKTVILTSIYLELLFLPVDSTKHFIDLIVVVVVDGGDDDDDVERGLMEY